MIDKNDRTEIPRWIDEPGPQGDAVRLYVERVRDAASTRASWPALAARLEARAPRRTGPMVAWALVGAMAAVGLLYGRSLFELRADHAAEVIAKAPATAPLAEPAPAPEGVAAPVELLPRELRLAANVVAFAEPGSVATASTVKGRRAVTLDRGRVEIRSSERDPA